jgi:hypothetical protein
MVARRTIITPSKLCAAAMAGSVYALADWSFLSGVLFVSMARCEAGARAGVGVVHDAFDDVLEYCCSWEEVY